VKERWSERRIEGEEREGEWTIEGGRSYGIE